MAATHQDPPILRLNHDILMRIIKMNANMFLDDDALKMTVITSAVCRRWRELMLSTPSLWGRLIDLNMLLDGTTDEWRYELMERTGTAVLWIAARGLAIPDDETGIMSFLADVLENEWDRVQKISLECIDGGYMHPRLSRWSALYLPAPNLQTFDIDFSEGQGDISHGYYVARDEDVDDTPLFSHNAPMLREFYARALRFDFGAPWLEHLHLLNIDIEITVNEVLTVLEAAPRLRELVIRQLEETELVGEAAPTPGPSLPAMRVSLQDLSHLVLFASFEAGTTLLAHLDLPRGCTAKIHLTYGVNDDAEQRTSDSDSDDSDDSDELEDSDDSDESCHLGMQLQTVSRLARNIFRVCTPRKVLLVFSQDGLAFEVEDDHTRDSDDSCFEFRVSFYGDHPPAPGAPTTVYTTTMAMAFLDAFTLPEELAQVTQFRLENSIADSLPDAIFEPFIACLSPSVTLLDAPGKTLAYLVEVQERLRAGLSNGNSQLADKDRPTVVLFPLVRTLKLDRAAIAYFARDQASAQAQAQARGTALIEYLRARARAGCPIGTLDLTECDADSLPRLDFLEEVVGLRVVWKRWGVKGKGVVDYVCGSGNPGRLRSFT